VSSEVGMGSGSSGVGGARLGPGWTDSHCHLQEPYLAVDLEPKVALAQAAESGVVGVVCVGTDAASSAAAVTLAKEMGEGDFGVRVWATVGLHPHEAGRGTKGVEDLLERALREGSPVVAVGECGLDYHYDNSPREAQRKAFAEQIAMAKAYGLALVVHTREAWDDTLEILVDEGIPDRVVMHCFTGGVEEARRCLELGAYLSFSGIVTFKSALDVREAASYCPEDRLLVETDAPFLAPVPERGKPNRPAWVAIVGRALAGIRGVDPERLAASSTRAAMDAFGIGQR